MLIGAAARLILITQPFVDSWAWREADVAMIARNLLHDGFNVLRPRIDWAGAAPGYVGTEFPLVPLLAALCYAVVGEHEWVGRGISVAFFLFSVPAFFLLVQLVFGRRAALLAATFYALAPLGIIAGQSFMPDMPSLALAIAGAYAFLRWLDDETVTAYLFVSAGAIALAILVKAPAAVIGLPLLYLVAERHGWNIFRDARLWLFALIALAPPALWYVHAVNLAHANPPFHFFGEAGFETVELRHYWPIFRWTFLELSHLTPVLSLLMAVGMFLPPTSRGRWFFHYWFIAMIVFVAIAPTGNFHPWYQLPFVPIAAALAGRTVDVAMERILVSSHSRALTALLPAVLIGGLAAMALTVQARYRPSFAPAHRAGLAVNRLTEPESLILVVSKGEPITFNSARRKGWHFFTWTFYSENAIPQLERCRSSGARYLVINRYYYAPTKQATFYAYLGANYRELVHDQDYLIYDLHKTDAQSDGRSASDKCLERY